MKYIINNSNNPYYNLAMEEYCLKNINIDEDYFILWQNEPSIIVGKNQNTIEEINSKFVEEKKIKVVRRISGGGAVYHDFGNLNFSFFANVSDIEKVDFKIYAQPIIRALNTFGLKAELRGRNDITIEGKKISGNAQRLYKNKLMHHGTLLFDVNIEDLVNALNVKMDKITSKGIKSVRSRVTNIKEHLNKEITILEFKEVIQRFLAGEDQSNEIELSKEDYIEIERLKNNKFSTWEWNYGTSPEFNIKNMKRFSGGKVEVLANVSKGVIKNIKFYGDYLGITPIDTIEERLEGCRYNIKKMRRKLEKVYIREYFGDITLDELLEVMFE